MTEFDPPGSEVRRVVALALAEDLGITGDITSLACVPADAGASASFVARQEGVLAGSAAATETFAQVDPGLECHWRKHDGERFELGEVIGTVAGGLRSILTAERVALNLVTHCSGVATLTRRYVEEVASVGSATRIRDSRKTLPGLRALEKAAVRAGGGANHRDSLSDAVLIKDNHLHATGVGEAVAAARARWPGRIVEVECDSLDQVREALGARPDIVLLDNMSVDDVRSAVDLVGGRVALEASGGVTLGDVGGYAATGVDYIAVGALTHSAPALDLGLDIDPE